VPDENLGRAVLELSTDNSGLDEGLDRAEQRTGQRMKALGASMTKAGKVFSLALTTPLIAGFGVITKAAAEQEEAMADLANAIRATGREGQISLGNLANLATELQRVTKFGDETSLAALTLVQQLANLDEEGLKQILPRIQNFAQAMTGGNLETAAALVGKTLGSTTNALSRYGVEIDGTASKSEKLTALIAALDQKFAGAAQTAAAAGMGPVTQLKNLLGDFGENLGAVILPLVQKLATWLGGIVDWLNKLSPSTRETIVTIAALAAALGPLLLIGGQLISGIGTLMAVFKGVGGAMSLLSAGPMGLIIAGVAALAVGVVLLIQNWDKVSAFFVNLWNVVKEAFQSAIAFIKDIFGKVVAWMWENAEYLALALGPVASAAVLIIKNWDQIREFFQKLWADVVGFFTNARDKIAAAIQSIHDNTIGKFKDLFDKIVGHSLVPDLVNATIDEFRRMDTGVQNIAQGIKDGLISGFGSAMAGVGEAIVSGGDAWAAFKDAAKNTIADVLMMIGKELLVWAIKASIPILGIFNPAGAALAYAGSAAAFIASGAIRALAGGGWLTEPVIGVGLETGTAYTMAENEPEYVGREGPRSSEPALIQVLLDSRVLAETTVDLLRSRKILVPIRSVVS